MYYATINSILDNRFSDENNLSSECFCDTPYLNNNSKTLDLVGLSKKTASLVTTLLLQYTMLCQPMLTIFLISPKVIFY